MRNIATLVAVVASFGIACAGPVFAQDTSSSSTVAIPAEHSLWGHGVPGAWSSVQVITETLNNDGTPSCVSKTKTKRTLMKIGANTTTLSLNVEVEIAGHRVDSQPKNIVQTFFGNPSNTVDSIRVLPAETVIIAGVHYPCQVFEQVIKTATQRTVTKIYYCKTRAPYLLKYVGRTTDLAETQVLRSSTVMVEAFDMPWRIRAEIKPVSILKSQVKTPNGSVVTWSVTCFDVPGGTVFHSSKELDAQGRLIRRSTLELIDYGLEPEQRGLFPIFDRTKPIGGGLRGRFRLPGTIP